MARLFTQDQRDLLRAPAVKARLLVTFFLDEGTYRFCDDVLDMQAADGNTYIGASALTESVEVRSGQDLAAEPITLLLDGNRMEQFGIEDPARVLRDIMGYLHQQRRVDFAYGLGYPDSTTLNLVIPVAAHKINHCRLIDAQLDFEADEPVKARLEILMDSLAMRYSRATFRTRSHADQKEIDPTDNFFSFVQDVVNSEKTIFWGRKAPVGLNSGGPGSSIIGGGAGGMPSAPGGPLVVRR